MSAHPKTILISINTAWNIVHFRASLVRALKADGYRIVSVAPDDAYTPALESMVDQHIALPMDNAGTSPLRDSMLFFRYLRILHTVRPSALLTYTIKPNIYGALAASMLGIPTIANVSGLGTAFLHKNWLTYLVARLYRLAFRGASCVFFQNPDDRDLFLHMKLVVPEKTRVIAGSGVDLEYFNPRHSLPAHSATHFVLIARMLKDKGIGEFVAAARIVKATHPHTRFRLVGPLGSQNQTAIAQTDMDAWVTEGVIEYLGATDDARSVMAQHDCIVLPSYREGLSRVLLEAAAMGKPIITTNVPGCKHAVEHDKTGLLCHPRDAQSLATSLTQFLQLSPDQRAQMGAEGRKKAEQEFGEEHVIAAYRTMLAMIIP
jgi:glycosyltransferase involved in cell wall biosynthesis